MIRLTKAEKADRYDSLQAAIRYTIEIWRDRTESHKLNYEACGADVGIIGAYNKGMADAYEAALETLERWKE